MKRIVCVLLGVGLAVGAGLRIVRAPALTIVSWSDAVLVEKTEEKPELLAMALRRDPASPFRWTDLGNKLLEQGKKEDARRCFERALVLGPNLVSNLWLAGEFYAQIGERQNTLRCFSRILELSPGYARSIFESYGSSDYQLVDVLNHGLPPSKPSIARDYFRALLAAKESEPIRQAWRWLAERSIPDRDLTNRYIDFLMGTKEYEEARETWISCLGENRGNYLSSEFIFNGGFEAEPSGSVFDWRIGAVKGVEVARVARNVQSGKYSLRIEFDGKENPDYRGVQQDVVLDPGKYRFTAYLRTEDISTDKGIFFRVDDVATEPLKGSHDWTRVELSVVVKETRRVRIEVRRQRSEKFDCLVRGRVWVDEVQMTRYE